EKRTTRHPISVPGRRVVLIVHRKRVRLPPHGWTNPVTIGIKAGDGGDSDAHPRSVRERAAVRRQRLIWRSIRRTSLVGNEIPHGLDTSSIGSDPWIGWLPDHPPLSCPMRRNQALSSRTKYRKKKGL